MDRGLRFATKRTDPYGPSLDNRFSRLWCSPFSGKWPTFTTVRSASGSASFCGSCSRSYFRYEVERDRARTEAQTATQVSGILVDLFESSNPMEEPDTLTARTLLREARIAALDDQPAVQARLLDPWGGPTWDSATTRRPTRCSAA